MQSVVVGVEVGGFSLYELLCGVVTWVVFVFLFPITFTSLLLLFRVHMAALITFCHLLKYS